MSGSEKVRVVEKPWILDETQVKWMVQRKNAFGVWVEWDTYYVKDMAISAAKSLRDGEREKVIPID